ncbi:MAG: acyl-CoA thioesterase [Treponema sp.]|jgi:acyl-CoA thioester hydrolase|nr:acyl-CoA thioesterase [Treponema sp.]
MFSITVSPRFGDIDALGHINNTVPSIWFELARTPVMQIFDPELTLSKETFSLILVHSDYDFVSQMYLKGELQIKTWISKIGTKSFTVHHEAWQENRLCVKGDAVIVHYDFTAQISTPLPEDKRKLLEEHLM